MELEFEKTMCRHLNMAAWGTQSQEQTLEVKLPDGMPDIGRVLGCWGQPVLRSKEWRSGGMTASGGVMAWTLYAPEDSTEPRCMESWIPFQLKWDLPETEREGSMQMECLLRSADARTISARKMMVRVCVSAFGMAMVPAETAVYSAGALPEDIQMLRKVYPLRLPKEAGEKTFLLDEELTVGSGCPEPEKLIRYDLQPVISEQKLIGERLIFRGSANLHLVYRTREGKLHSCDLEIPFSQFTDLDRDFEHDPSVQITPALTSLEVELDEEGRIRVKAGLVAQYLVWEREMLELVEDAYSPQRSVEMQRQTLMLPAGLEDRCETIRGEQILPCQPERIVDVSFLHDFPRAMRQGENLTLEIPCAVQVLCYDEQGNMQCVSGHWDCATELQAASNTQILPMARAVGRPQAVASSEGITVKADVAADIRTLAGESLNMVTGLNAGELSEPDPGRPSLILLRCGDQGLWELAKASGSTMEAIRQANLLESEPEKGRILLIPVP